VGLYRGFGRCLKLVIELAQCMPDAEPNGDCRSRHPDRHGCPLAETEQVHRKVVLGQRPDLSMMEDVHLRRHQAMQVQRLEGTNRKGRISNHKRFRKLLARDKRVQSCLLRSPSCNRI
jgi:hypothetical protein